VLDLSYNSVSDFLPGGFTAQYESVRINEINANTIGFEDIGEYVELKGNYHSLDSVWILLFHTIWLQVKLWFNAFTWFCECLTCLIGVLFNFGIIGSLVHGIL